MSKSLAFTALVTALRKTADRLATGAAYQWGHFGQCNCGHLAQTMLGISHVQLHQVALEGDGDWEMIANQYCPTSGRPIDDVVAELLRLGMTTSDIGHLEKLSDPQVLAALPNGRRWLRRNDRLDVIEYMQAWASILQPRHSALVDINEATSRVDGVAAATLFETSAELAA